MQMWSCIVRGIVRARRTLTLLHRILSSAACILHYFLKSSRIVSKTGVAANINKVLSVDGRGGGDRGLILLLMTY